MCPDRSVKSRTQTIGISFHPCHLLALQENRETEKADMLYIYEQDGHLFQWVAGPRPQQHPFLYGKGGGGVARSRASVRQPRLGAI